MPTLRLGLPRLAPETGVSGGRNVFTSNTSIEPRRRVSGCEPLDRHRRDAFYPLLAFNTAAGMLSLGFGAWVVPMMARAWHLTIPQVGATLG